MPIALQGNFQSPAGLSDGLYDLDDSWALDTAFYDLEPHTYFEAEMSPSEPSWYPAVLKMVSKVGFSYAPRRSRMLRAAVELNLSTNCA